MRGLSKFGIVLFLVIIVACGKKVDRKEGEDSANKTSTEQVQGAKREVVVKNQTIHQGRGAPSNDLGDIGDTYINLEDGSIFKKGLNSWEFNDKFDQLTKDVKGKSLPLIVVAIQKDSEIPKVMDENTLYLNVNSQKGYALEEGKKKLVYDGKGLCKAQVHFGESNPNDEFGNENDIFINKISKEYLRKFKGKWRRLCEYGADKHLCGDFEPNGNMGEKGDVYVQTGGIVYFKYEKNWVKLHDQKTIQVVEKRIDIKVEPIFSKEDIENPERGILYYIQKSGKGYIYRNGALELAIEGNQPVQPTVHYGTQKPVTAGYNKGDIFILNNQDIFHLQSDHWVYVGKMNLPGKMIETNIKYVEVEDIQSITSPEKSTVYYVTKDQSVWGMREGEFVQVWKAREVKKISQKEILIVENEPKSVEGKIGDFRIVRDGRVYEKQVNESWKHIDTVGPEIIRFPRVFRGEGYPESDLDSRDGDMYLSYGEDVIFEKVDGRWIKKVAHLKIKNVDSVESISNPEKNTLYFVSSTNKGYSLNPTTKKLDEVINGSIVQTKVVGLSNLEELYNIPVENFDQNTVYVLRSDNSVYKQLVPGERPEMLFEGIVKIKVYKGEKDPSNVNFRIKPNPEDIYIRKNGTVYKLDRENGWVVIHETKFPTSVWNLDIKEVTDIRSMEGHYKKETLYVDIGTNNVYLSKTGEDLVPVVINELPRVPEFIFNKVDPNQNGMKGENHDFYLDQKSGKIYQMIGGNWVFKHKLNFKMPEVSWQKMTFERKADIGQMQKGIIYHIASNDEGWALINGQETLVVPGKKTRMPEIFVDENGPHNLKGEEGDVWIQHSGEVHVMTSTGWKFKEKIPLMERVKTVTSKVEQYTILLNAEWKQATIENMKGFELPYIAGTNSKKKKVENLYTDAVNEKKGSKSYVQNGQVLFVFDLNKVKVDLSKLGQIRSAKLKLHIKKVYGEKKEHDTEILCFLNTKECSGKIYPTSSSYRSFVSSSFFSNGNKDVINSYFLDQLLSGNSGSESGNKIITLEHTFSFDKLFNIDNARLKTEILRNKVLGFVVADDIQLMSAPVLEINF